MQRITHVLGTLVALAAPLAAAADPIDIRKALMSSNGAAAGVSVAMFRQELAYDPAVALLALRSLSASAAAFGDYFPEGSEDPARSRAAPAVWSDRAGFDAELAKFQAAAAPAVWSDRAGFDAELAKFQAAAAAAVEAAGRDGPPDLAAFQAAAGPVLETCRTCHETYQLRNE
jgi:cytochrome c556